MDVTEIRAERIGAVENEVLIGREGHLFLAGGGHRILEFADGLLEPAETSFKAFDANIARRATLCQQRGMHYRHIVFPDKQSVLEHAYPRRIGQRLGLRHLEQCPGAAPHVFYPLALLTARRQDCFLRVDTHLSDTGSLVVAQELVASLSGAEVAAESGTLLARVLQEKQSAGDLGSKLDPPVSATERYVMGDWGERLFTNKIVGNNGAVDIWISPRSLLPSRVLLFGDSFGRALARFLSFTYREVVMLRTPFLHDEILGQMRPDIVLTENVERYLDNVRPDALRPSFQMLPWLGGREQPPVPPNFAAAFSAILSFPRPPYQQFWKRFA